MLRRICTRDGGTSQRFGDLALPPLFLETLLTMLIGFRGFCRWRVVWLVTALRVSGAVCGDAAEPGHDETASATSHAATNPALPTSDKALEMLLEGNRRFAEGKPKHPHETLDWRAHLRKGQHPFAVIVGCSDSRVSPELLFDEGLGDLFVIRQAGHVADDDTLASVEYAIGHLHVRLVVVLGHESCGAVEAAVATLMRDEPAPGHIIRLVDDIAPAVKAAGEQPGEIVENAVQANIRHVVDQLRNSMPILRPLVRSDQLRIVGAYYALETGRVRLTVP